MPNYDPADLKKHPHLRLKKSITRRPTRNQRYGVISYLQRDAYHYLQLMAERTPNKSQSKVINDLLLMHGKQLRLPDPPPFED